MLAAPTQLEVVTMGRISVDLYPEQIGVSLAEVRTFNKSLGGSASNVAVGAARLGRQSAVITRVGADGFGEYLRKALEGFGVYAGWVGTDPSLRTPLAFCEIFPPDHFPLLFYREPKAPDLNLVPDDFDAGAVAGVPLLWTTGVGLSEEPSRSTTLEAMRSHRGRIRVHDLDYRPMLWKDGGEATRWAKEAVRLSTVVVGNQSEVEMAVGTREGSARRRASWSGLRNSAHHPLPVTFTEASCPALRSSTQVPISSSSVSRRPSSTTWASALIKSSFGWARRSCDSARR